LHKEITKGTKKIHYVSNAKAENIYEKVFSKNNIVHIFDPVDHEILERFNLLANKKNVSLNIYDSPLFMETNEDLETYYDNLKSHSNFIHDNGFYKWQRQRLNILMDDNDKPL
jgi:deoxyribodipyrimidine photolyase-related protein